MKAKIAFHPKQLRNLFPQQTEKGDGRGGEDTKYYKSELKSCIPGGSFCTGRLSSHQVISKKSW